MENETKIELTDDIINRESPEYKKVMEVMRDTAQIADKIRKHTAPSLMNERYLTTNNMIALFQISRRALQNYRDSGIIPFIAIGRVILYPESEVKKAFEKNYYKQIDKKSL